MLVRIAVGSVVVWYDLARPKPTRGTLNIALYIVVGTVPLRGMFPILCTLLAILWSRDRRCPFNPIWTSLSDL